MANSHQILDREEAEHFHHHRNFYWTVRLEDVSTEEGSFLRACRDELGEARPHAHGFHSNPLKSKCQHFLCRRDTQNFNGKREVEVRAVVKNLHGAEFWGKFFAKFWGKFFANGWKGKEASWAGIRGRFALPRFQLLDHDPSSGGAQLSGV